MNNQIVLQLSRRSQSRTTPTAFPDWRRPHRSSPHTHCKGKGRTRVGRSPAWLRVPGNNVPSMCPSVGAEGSCFLERQCPTPGSQVTSCMREQPMAPSFCPLPTKRVFQLGMGAVPGTSMSKAVQTGKSCSSVEFQLAGPRPCIPSKLPYGAFQPSGAQTEDTV